MLKKMFVSYLLLIWRKRDIVAFVAMLFSLLYLLFSFVVTPIFNTSVPILVSSGSGLPSIGSGLMSALTSSGSGGTVNDEINIFTSIDTKKKVFYKSADKVLWYKIDQDIRNYITFSPISLDYEKTKIKLVTVSKKEFDIYFSNRKNGISKLLPFTSFTKVGSGRVGEVVSVKGIEFLITKSRLNKGKTYKIEIGYKYPKDVFSNEFNKISATTGGDFSNLLIASCSESDPVRSVELLNEYVEEYLKMRYSKVLNDESQSLELFKKNIYITKERIDSLNMLLKDFAYNNSMFMPDQELSAMISSLSEAINSKLQKEIQYKVSKQFNYGSNLEASMYKKSADELDKHITNIKSKIYKEYPLKMARYYDISANLQANKEIYKNLLVQKEQAKVSSLKEIGNRWILEKPSYPFFRTKPQRFKSLIRFFIIGIFLAIAYIIFLRITAKTVNNLFDIKCNKVITIAKDINRELIVRERFADFSNENSVIGQIDTKYKGYVDYLKEKLGDLKVIHNLEFYNNSDEKFIIIPIKYGEVSKDKLNELIEKFENSVVVVVFDVKKEAYYLYDYFTEEDLKLI